LGGKGEVGKNGEVVRGNDNGNGRKKETGGGGEDSVINRKELCQFGGTCPRASVESRKRRFIPLTSRALNQTGGW